MVVIAGTPGQSRHDAATAETQAASVVDNSSAGRTLVVDLAGDYGSIQDAIDAAAAGDTILVHSGVYYEQLNVYKPLAIEGVDTGGGLPVIDGLQAGDVVTVAADNVTLEGFGIRDSKDDAAGIRVIADGATLAGNEVAGCDEGILIDHTNDSLVDSNHLHDNSDAGVYLTNGSGNRVEGNHANDNLYGIYMQFMNGTVVRDNNCSDNIDIEIYMEHINDSAVLGNTALSERIKDKKIDGIGIRYGDNVTFGGNYVSRHYYGIKVYDSENCLVEDNVADGSGVNVRLDFGTHDTTLLNNTVRNGVDNIYVHTSAYDNLIENNTCYNGREGVYLLDCPPNVVTGNEVYNNTIGIRLINTSGSDVYGNYAHDNSVDIDDETGANSVRDNFNCSRSPTPVPAEAPTATPGATPSPSPAPAAQGGNPVVDFISSVIRAIFH